MVELKDEELKNVNGGYSTGDKNNKGEVYFKFPLILSSLSGFYSRASLEKLCSDNIGLAPLAKQYINQDVKNAVKILYGDDPIPAAVQTMLG